MVFAHASYREYLSRVLEERKARNRAYSLRALARQLHLDAAFFSRVIKGRSPLSLQQAPDIAQRLGLEGDQFEYFTLLVQLDHVRNDTQREQVQRRIESLRPSPEAVAIDTDHLQFLSVWYHVPIFMMALVGYPGLDAAAVARRLNLPEEEAGLALERIERLGLIARDEQGHYVRGTGAQRFTLTAHQRNAALQRYHAQMLRRAELSLERQTPTERITTSETFPFRGEDLPEAERITKEYLSKMTRLSSAADARSEIYHLGVQFFRLTGDRPDTSGE